MLKLLSQTRDLFLNTEPRTPGALHAWIETALGYRLPRQAPTAGTDAIFDVVADCFFGQNNAILLGSRGAGKSTIMSILNLLLSKFRPGLKTLHAGAIERHSSDVCHVYLKEMLQRADLMHELQYFQRDDVVWRNGSRLMTTSGSSESGTVALRCHRLSLDEVDLFSPDLFSSLNLACQGDDQHPAQRLFVSTRYTGEGLMSTLLDEAESRGYRVYRVDVWGSMANCRQCEGESCPLYKWESPNGIIQELCQGRGLLSDGFVPLESVIGELFAVDPATWQVQKLLGAPQRQSLLFAFERERHTGKAPPEAFSSESRKIAGIDWGYSTTPFAITVFAECGDTLWGIAEHTEYMAGPDRELEIAKSLNEKYGPILAWYVGHDRPELSDALGGLFVVLPCPVRERERRHRIIRRLLARGRLKFDGEAMARTVRELSTVGYNPKTGKEWERQAIDHIDATEYAVASYDIAGGDVMIGGALVG